MKGERGMVGGEGQWERGCGWAKGEKNKERKM